MSTPRGNLDTARLRAIAASDRPLAPHECAERARLAAALIDPGRLDRSGPGEAVLLWRDEHSEAWLNLWWQPRDTGYHDHTGSCVGVHVIEGRAWNEPLTIGQRPEVREYSTGETFWFPGEGIHRMDHQAGAITIHVYSPPIRAIGHYDLSDGQLRRTQRLPDQPSPPSAALREALHRPTGADPASRRPAANLCRQRRAQREGGTAVRPAEGCYSFESFAQGSGIRCCWARKSTSTAWSSTPRMTPSPYLSWVT